MEVKGTSLAKGPALIVGSILLAFGLLGLLWNATFPTDTATGGTVQGETVFGIEVNGWTNWFTIVAGGLLLFGAAQHLLAKTMSLLVGLALAACAVIATIDGEDVFGLAAANVWTKIGWAGAAAVLLLNTLMPRRTRTVPATTAESTEPTGRGSRFRRDKDAASAPERPVAGRTL